MKQTSSLVLGIMSPVMKYTTGLVVMLPGAQVREHHGDSGHVIDPLAGVGGRDSPETGDSLDRAHHRGGVGGLDTACHRGGSEGIGTTQESSELLSVGESSKRPAAGESPNCQL